MQNTIKARSKPRSPFKVEIIANYPKYRDKDVEGLPMIIGTFHVYIENLDLDLRGIHYIWKKGRFHIRYPSRKGSIDGDPCDYLIFSFCSPEKQKQLTQALKDALKEFSKTDDYVRECKQYKKGV